MVGPCKLQKINERLKIRKLKLMHKQKTLIVVS